MNKLYILCGIPFSGKTTLAKKIAQNSEFIRIDLDEVKFDIFGKETKDADISKEGWNKIYQEMYKRIENNLKNGKNVINDTGNFTKNERDKVRQIADKLGLITKIIYIKTPEEIAYKRLLENRRTKKRFDVSDEDFKSTVKEMEVPQEDENTVTYNPGITVDSWIKTL